ncbi:acyl-CoA acyltransferase [Bradyrhizobium sp. 83002]|uniref:acyl-CoA acyltransferase n=1 Tax=Bradyrhizobium aeschynomenes TaxID=2734909 RepID=UPI00155313EA|nr:acyl-CoA acyltransferase [Bradyrhizobium aeschynomenes]NPU12077.1 acyl-CoA acyltransferase [Bradyrhizobium aeschynomenes]
MTALKPVIRCREIGETDLDAVADLLTRGFPRRSRDYWSSGLRRQAGRAVPDGYPRYGYLLDHNGVAVGVLLLIYSDRGTPGEPQIWCNLSSWYVEPAFRNYATMLTRIAQRRPEVTYVNISAARPTWPIVEAQGFRAYCRGLFFSLPLLSTAGLGSPVDRIDADAEAVDGLPPDEAALLIRHARYGCLSVVVRSKKGPVPLVLQKVRIRQGRFALPAMQLIYCRDISDYVGCAGAIGRLLLLRRGCVSVMTDANGPIDGLIGIYTERRGLKYIKGPQPPRLGDLSDTELPIYGA